LKAVPGICSTIYIGKEETMRCAEQICPIWKKRTIPGRRAMNHPLQRMAYPGKKQALDQKDDLRSEALACQATEMPKDTQVVDLTVHDGKLIPI